MEKSAFKEKSATWTELYVFIWTRFVYDYRNIFWVMN